MRIDLLTSSSENFARDWRREGRSGFAYFFLYLSLFPGQRLFSSLVCAWSLRLRNWSNHSKARVVWYPRLSARSSNFKSSSSNAHRERKREPPPALSSNRSPSPRVNSEREIQKVIRARSFSAQSSFYHHEIQLSDVHLLTHHRRFVCFTPCFPKEREKVREKERKKDQKSKKKIKMRSRFRWK